MLQQLWQLRNISRDAPRLVVGEQVRRWRRGHEFCSGQVGRTWCFVHYTMFIRYRVRKGRLHVSFVATSRDKSGRVRHRHLAALGVVRNRSDVAPWVSPYERANVWWKLFNIADDLHLDAALLLKLLNNLQARVPFPSDQEFAAVIDTLSRANALARISHTK